ncbi:hypothetical protein EBZ80_25310 [bacterium]|nr:hypothetical protein [bacterium]
MPAANVNVPFVAAMSADGTALLETVKQETYTFTGSAHYNYTGVLTPEIIAAFTLSEGAADSAAQLDVDVAGLTAPLTAALEAARASIEADLTAFAQSEIDADLASNTIGAAVEAEAVKNLVLSIDTSGAAAAMETGIAALSAATRRLIATQLPSTRFPEAFSTALPLVSGDSMTFRWNASTNITVSEDAQDLGGAADGGADGTAAAGAGPGVGTGYGVDVRVLELVLTKA